MSMLFQSNCYEVEQALEPIFQKRRVHLAKKTSCQRCILHSRNVLRRRIGWNFYMRLII